MGRKHWKKEKLIVMGNYSFSHSVFKRERVILQTSKNKGLFGKGLTLSQMTNFRLFQTERVCRRQFKLDKNGRQFSRWIENTAGKGEIVVTSNFSFSHRVFKRLLLQTCKNQGLFGKGLIFVKSTVP